MTHPNIAAAIRILDARVVAIKRLSALGSHSGRSPAR